MNFAGTHSDTGRGASQPVQRAVFAAWPLLMLMLMGFLLWVGIILPLADLAAGSPVAYKPRWSELPAGFWDFLGIGVGGYIGGCTKEKIASQVITTRRS